MIENRTGRPFAYLTTLQVAELKGYSDSFIQRACQRGEIPYIRIGERGPYLIHREDADNFLTECSVAPIPSLLKESKIKLDGYISVTIADGKELRDIVLRYAALFGNFPRVVVNGAHLAYITNLGYGIANGADSSLNLENQTVYLGEPERDWERVRIT